jgi:phosphoribosylformimino-5-aminoimidazole carboxamide ribotide isomerase
LRAYAAIDLRGGRVVQLVGGRVEDERISLPDPVAVARQWETAGFAALHIVDLDAALGESTNLEHVAAIIKAVRVPVQVGGGVRDDAHVEKLIELGAERVIVGTRAIEDGLWRTSIARRHPGRMIIAADVRAGTIVSRGWTTDTPYAIDTFLELLDDLPLGAVLVTDVSREGQMTGVDEVLFERLARVCKHPLIAAGGIRDTSDLTRLARAGAAGAVLGMALYQGAIELNAITSEFAA